MEDVKIGSIIDGAKRVGSLKEYQRVVCVGCSVRNVKEGDLVKINPSRYEIHKFEENSVKKDILGDQVVGYRFPMETINGVPHLLLRESDIEFVITDYEETEDTTPSIITKPNVIA